MGSAGRIAGGKAMAGLAALAAAAGILTGVAPSAAGADFRLTGETMSVLESRDDPATGEALSPFYQYLRLGFAESGGGGQRFALYGRLAGDLGGDSGADSRLYYAWYEKKGIFPGADLRVGRQWVNTVAGSPVIDGAVVKSPLWGHQLTAFVGGYVDFDDQSPDAWVWGVEMGRRCGGAEASLSYLQKREGSVLARELLGGELSVAIPWNGSAYGEFQYDLVSGVLAYWLAGARVSPSPRLSLRAECLGTTPVFDSGDIYSVFAADQYSEASFKADYRLDREWFLFAGYTREFYRQIADAGVGEAGVELRRTAALHGYLSGVWRKGDEDLAGVKASVGGPVFLGIDGGVGVEYDVYSRVGDEKNSDTSARRYWVEGRRPFGGDLTLAGKFERIESAVYEYYNRGRLSLTYRF
jgi:hypothetical protein